MPETAADGREFTDEQLRAALKEIGREVREKAFAAGLPLFVVRDGALVALHPDGTVEVIEHLQGAGAGAKG